MKATSLFLMKCRRFTKGIDQITFACILCLVILSINLFYSFI